MKKKILLTGLATGLCSQVLLSTALANEADTTETDPAVIESMVDADVEKKEGAEGAGDENKTNEEDDVEKEDGDDEGGEKDNQEAVFTLTYKGYSKEALEELVDAIEGNATLSAKLDVSTAEVTESGGVYTLTLDGFDEEDFTAEDKGQVDYLYTQVPSSGEVTLTSPVAFDSVEEVEAFAGQVVQNLPTDDNGIQVSARYSVGPDKESDGYKVTFHFNESQIQGGATLGFGQDLGVYLYDGDGQVIGQAASEDNAPYTKEDEKEPESNEGGENQGDQGDNGGGGEGEENPNKPGGEQETPGEGNGGEDDGGSDKVDVEGEEVDSVEEVIPFETVTEEDPNLLAGAEKVTQEGVNGIKVVTTTQKTLNGEPVGEPIVTEEVKVEPTNQVVAVGIGQPEDVEEVKEELIPFSTETRETRELLKGEERVVQEGVEGVKVIKTVTPMFNGEKVGGPSVSEEIVKQPVNKIIEVGIGEKETPKEEPKEEERVDTREEIIPYEVEERESANRPKGERVIVQKGVDGIKVIKTTQKYQDGQKVGQPVVEESVKREAVKEIVEIGTKEAQADQNQQNQNNQTNQGSQNTQGNQTGGTTTTAPGQTTTPNAQPSGQTQQQQNQAGQRSPGTITTTSEYVTIARKHTVQPGETIQTVAEKYNTTPEKIKEWNNLTSDYVYQGQVLVVSEAMKVPVEEYVAVQGDTAQVIAERFGMTVQDLESLNGGAGSLATIQQGQVIRVIDLKKGFGEDAHKTTGITQAPQGGAEAAPLADQAYEQARVEERVVPIPETGESNITTVAGIAALALGTVAAYFGFKKRGENEGVE